MATATIQAMLQSMDWQSIVPTGAWPVLNALQRCRTQALGWHLMQCDNTVCQQRKTIYHSCRNRHCPQCGFRRQEEWIENRMNELLPCNYFHIVFTLPHELNALCLANRKFFFDLLFKASAQTVMQFCKKGVTKTPGIISVLHTWGQQMSFHPHVHLLVSGAGIDETGTFKSLAKANGYYLFPVKAMRMVYKSIVLKDLYLALKKNKLIIPKSQHLILKNLLCDLKEKEWIVYAKRPFAGPEQVIAYLGRYTHRVAISNQRIKKIGESDVAFWYKDYADNSKKKLMLLRKEEFLRRFAQHILPKGYMKIRSYGLFSNYKRKTRLADIRAQNKLPDPQHTEPLSLERWLSRLLRNKIGKCPCCKTGNLQTLVIIYPKKHEDAISWRKERDLSEIK